MEPMISSQQKVQEALASAVATLCKRMLNFNSAIRVEGLLGITLDAKSVVLVNILEEVNMATGDDANTSTNGLADVDTKDFEINAENAAFLEKLLTQPREGDTSFDADHWNNDLDMKIPESLLAEFLDKVPVDKSELIADEPQKQDSKKKKGKCKKKAKKDVENLNVVKEELPVESTSQQPELNLKNDHSVSKVNSLNGKKPTAGLFDCSDDLGSQPGRTIAQSLGYLGDHDSFLPMGTDDALDYFAPASPSAALDCNGLNGTLNLAVNLDKPLPSALHKQDTSLSLREHSDQMDHQNGSLSDIASSAVDPDFDDTSTTTGEKFPCNLCGVVFSHKRSLWRHKNKHKNKNDSWPCDICSQVFSRKDIMMRHKNQHKSKHRKSTKCPICKKLFSRLDSFQRHISLSHGDKMLDGKLSMTG